MGKDRMQVGGLGKNYMLKFLTRRAIIAWALPRNDHNAGGHLVAVILEIIFDPSGICNSSFRIIDNTKKSAARGVLFIFGNVDNKLLAELLCRQAGSCQLRSRAS